MRYVPPFANHILNPLDMRIHQDPLYLGQKFTQKCLESNTSQALGNFGSFSPPLLVDPMPMTNLPPAGQTANQRSGCSGSEQVRLVLRGGQGSEQEGWINSWK